MSVCGSQVRASQRSGSAPQSRLFYLFKCTAYVVIGLTVSTLFAGVGNPLNVSNWWAEPIVYQKFLLFAILWELCGLGASSGPAGFHYVPRFGANKYWSKVGVIKRPPFGGRLPGQGGDTRSIVDVAVYYALALSLVVGIVIPPTNHDYVAEYIPGADGGMLPMWSILVPLVLILFLGYRCQHLFLGMRNDQYFLALLFALVLNPHDYIIGVKMIIVLVWMGAGVSKFGRHFEYVVPVMMANAPYMLSKRVSRLFFRKHPHDLQPSWLSLAMAHVLGTVVELICPLVLLLSGNFYAAAIAAFVIIGMHIVIILSMPIAVPLEWNIHYILLTVFIFFGFPVWEGYGLGSISSVWAGVFIFFCVLIGPVLGNLKPEWISFLISMRQYAGNWACTVWAFSPEGIEKMYTDYPGAIPRPRRSSRPASAKKLSSSSWTRSSRGALCTPRAAACSRCSPASSAPPSMATNCAKASTCPHGCWAGTSVKATSTSRPSGRPCRSTSTSSRASASSHTSNRSPYTNRRSAT